MAIAANTAFFTLLGVAIGVRSNIPFPLLSALSVLPAIGLIPWLRLRINHPIAVIIMAAVIVLATKLLGCIAARLVYGPDYIAKGYVSDDWHAAKLMITTLWFLTTTLSIGALLHTLYHAPSPPAA